jgi:hypothetical protein
MVAQASLPVMALNPASRTKEPQIVLSPDGNEWWGECFQPRSNDLLFTTQATQIAKL